MSRYKQNTFKHAKPDVLALPRVVYYERRPVPVRRVPAEGLHRGHGVAPGGGACAHAQKE